MLDESKIVEKYTIPNQLDENLKKVAKDLYDNLIYSDRHCKPNEVMQRFMVLMFMGPQAPKYPSENKDLQGERDNKLYDLTQREEDQKVYEFEKKCFQENYITDIGFIYEYWTEQMPRSLNGGPMFMSCRLLNKKDTEKMFEYYELYKSLRQSIDESF